MDLQNGRVATWAWAWPAGRVLLALLFLISGALKLGFHAPIAGAIASKGVPAADLVAWLVAAFEIAAAVMLAFKIRLFETALALAAWCLLTALMFHAFWAATGVDQQNQFTNFLKNIALVGAFLIVAADARRAAALAHPDRSSSDDRP